MPAPCCLRGANGYWRGSRSRFNCGVKTRGCCEHVADFTQGTPEYGCNNRASCGLTGFSARNHESQIGHPAWSATPCPGRNQAVTSPRCIHPPIAPRRAPPAVRVRFRPSSSAILRRERPTQSRATTRHTGSAEALPDQRADATDGVAGEHYHLVRAQHPGTTTEYSFHLRIVEPRVPTCDDQHDAIRRAQRQRLGDSRGFDI